MASSKIALHMASRLKQLRKKYKLTQEQVAERAHMDIRYYQKLESKSPYTVRIDTLARLAKVFGVKPSKLID